MTSLPTTATAGTPPARQFRHPSSRWRLGRWILLVATLAVLVCIATVLFAKFWPFSQPSVMQSLMEATDSSLTVQHYRATYFPPGCVLEGLEFRHGGAKFKFLTIDKLIVEGSYVGILRRHVPRITAIAAKVFIAPFGSNIAFKSQRSRVVVDEIVANGSLVEFQSKVHRQRPLRFDVYEARLNNVRWGSPIQYHLKLHNPEPPGELLVEGKFGAWATGHPDDTPISGEYAFEHADLGVYGGIGGVLASKGKFSGSLGHVNIAGSTDVPDFVVKTGEHKVRLETRFDAYVDATRGDTFLKRVEAHFGRTTVIAQGEVASKPGHKGKIADFHLTSQRGRIDDLLSLFTSDPQPAMSGEVSLQANAEIPPGDEPFLHKVRLQGKFGIGAGNFDKPETQQNVNELSAGASGESKDNAENVLTDLAGQVDLAEGVARFTNLSFGIPGANARMHGTFNIINQKIDLHGNMHVDTKISKTTSGFKSFLLKLMDPIFKKKNRGEVVPVHIAGTYEKPQFGLDLTGSKQQPPKHENIPANTSR